MKIVLDSFDLLVSAVSLVILIGIVALLAVREYETAIGHAVRDVKKGQKR